MFKFGSFIVIHKIIHSIEFSFFLFQMEKHHLKMLRRLHRRTMQNLKERLFSVPLSYNLRFNRENIDFARLKPYLYALVHEVSFLLRVTITTL